jgi:RNA polymerase sigma factor (sigma-70 family)
VDTESAGFAEFYAAARDNCLRAVFASTGDLPAAEDLVAEAFARAWARWRTVRSHPAPAAWVVRTALNARVSWWRRTRREVSLPEADTQDADLAGRLALGDDGGVGAGLDRTVMAALLRLPERQRQVVALRVFLDLDTAQTARALGIAPGTVTAHLARATAALRDQLTPGITEPTGQERL